MLVVRLMTSRLLDPYTVTHTVPRKLLRQTAWKWDFTYGISNILYPAFGGSEKYLYLCILIDS